MSSAREYGYARYLSAKKTVDDRALNQYVLAHVAERLRARPGAVHVLDVGAGIGTMLARLVDWGVLTEATYTLLDEDSRNLTDARRWLEEWATRTGRAAASESGAFAIRDSVAGIDVRVETLEAEIGRFLREPGSLPKAHLLVSSAFLDLVDLPSTLPALLDLLAPDGTYWFSINFDGESIFEPAHAYDEELLTVYHRSMDARVRHGRKAGSSKAGRSLFTHLRAAGASIARAGSSDWVVHAPAGRYPADEAHFLHHIVHTVDEELRKHADVDRARLAEWVAVRREQIERGDLVYVAHQLDFAGEQSSER